MLRRWTGPKLELIAGGPRCPGHHQGRDAYARSTVSTLTSNASLLPLNSRQLRPESQKVGPGTDRILDCGPIANCPNKFVDRVASQGRPERRPGVGMLRIEMVRCSFSRAARKTQPSRLIIDSWPDLGRAGEVRRCLDVQHLVLKMVGEAQRCPRGGVCQNGACA